MATGGPGAPDDDMRPVEKKRDERVLVHVRVRPLNPNEDAQMVVVSSPERRKLAIVRDPTTGQGARNFGFDRVYWSLDGGHQFDGQRDIYEDIGRLMLDHAFAGFNTCIFAYGQTGSGKTYTMMGDHRSSDPEDRGVIPRACAELFDKIDQGYTTVRLRDDDDTGDDSTGPLSPPNDPERWGVPESPSGNAIQSYEVHCSYYEIYNEKVYDLMNSEKSDQKSGEKGDLRVREHPTQGPYVENLTIEQVYLYEDVQSMLVHGNRNRHTNQTKLNDRSSRSHAIFTILLKQSVFMKGELHEYVSRINLVDLAGSERTKNAGTSGDTLVEGININKSLCTLGQVIHNLAESHERQKSMYINFRDSNLTWLLRENLGGNSKTIMVATISPAASCYDESLNTLRYADRVKQIRQKAIVNEDSKTKLIRDLRQEVAHLRRENMEIQRLRHELMCLQKRAGTPSLNVPHVHAGEDPYVVVLVPNAAGRHPIACRINTTGLLLTSPGDRTSPREHAARHIHPSVKLPPDTDFTVMHIPTLPRGAAMLVKESGKTEAVFGNRASRLIPLAAECRIARDPSHKTLTRAIQHLVHGNVFQVGDAGVVLRYADPSSVKAEDPVVQSIMQQQVEAIPRDVKDLTGEAPAAGALPPVEGPAIEEILDQRVDVSRLASQAKEKEHANAKDKDVAPGTPGAATSNSGGDGTPRHPAGPAVTNSTTVLGKYPVMSLTSPTPTGTPYKAPHAADAGGAPGLTLSESMARGGASNLSTPRGQGDGGSSLGGSLRSFGRPIAGNLSHDQRATLVANFPAHLKELFDKLTPAQQDLFLATQQPYNANLGDDERQRVERTQEEYLRKLAGSTVPRTSSWTARDRDATLGLNDTEIKQYCNLTEEQRKTFDALTPDLQRELLASLPTPDEFDKMDAEDLIAASEAINGTLGDLLARADAQETEAIGALTEQQKALVRTLSPTSRRKFLKMSECERTVFEGLSTDQRGRFVKLTGRQREEFVKLSDGVPKGGAVTAAQERLLGLVSSTAHAKGVAAMAGAAAGGGGGGVRPAAAALLTQGEAQKYEYLTEQQKETFARLPADKQRELLAAMPAADVLAAMDAEELIEATNTVAERLTMMAAEADAIVAEEIAALPVQLRAVAETLDPVARKRLLAMSADEQATIAALTTAQQRQFLALSEGHQEHFLRLAHDPNSSDAKGAAQLTEAQERLLELAEVVGGSPLREVSASASPSGADATSTTSLTPAQAQSQTLPRLNMESVKKQPKAGDADGALASGSVATSVGPLGSTGRTVGGGVEGLIERAAAATAALPEGEASEEVKALVAMLSSTLQEEKKAGAAAAEAKETAEKEATTLGSKMEELEQRLVKQQEASRAHVTTINDKDSVIFELRQQVGGKASRITDLEEQNKELEKQQVEIKNESQKTIALMDLQVDEAQKEVEARNSLLAEVRAEWYQEREAYENQLKDMESRHDEHLQDTVEEHRVRLEESEECVGMLEIQFQDAQDKHAQAIQDAERRMASVTAKNAALEKMLAEERYELETTMIQKDASEELLERTRNAFNDLQIEYGVLSSKIQALEQTVTMKAGEVARLRELEVESQSALTHLREEYLTKVAEVEDKTTALLMDRESQKERLREAEDKARLTEEQLVQKELELGHFRVLSDQKEIARAAVETQCSLLQARIEGTLEEMNRMQQEIADVESHLRAKEDAIKGLHGEKARLTEAYAKETCEQRRARESAMQEQQGIIRELTQQLNQVQSRVCEIELKNRDLYHSQEKVRNRRVQLQTELNMKESELKETKVKYLDAHTRLQTSIRRGKEGRKQIEQVRRLTTIVKEQEARIEYLQKELKESQAHTRRLEEFNANSHSSEQVERIRGDTNAVMGALKAQVIQFNPPALRQITTIVNSVQHATDPRRIFRQAFNHIRLVVTEISGRQDLNIGGAWDVDESLLGRMKTFQRASVLKALREIVVWHGVSADFTRQEMTAYIELTMNSKFLLSLAMFCQNPNMPDFGRGGTGIEDLSLRPLILAGRRGQRGNRGQYAGSPSRDPRSKDAPVGTLLALDDRDRSSHHGREPSVSTHASSSHHQTHPAPRSRSSPHAPPSTRTHYDPEPHPVLPFSTHLDRVPAPSYITDVRTPQAAANLVASSQRHLLNFTLPLAFEGLSSGHQHLPAKSRQRSLSEKKSPPHRPAPLSPPNFGTNMRTTSPSYASLPATYREYRAIDLNDPLPMEYEEAVSKKKVDYDPKKKNFMQGTVSSQGKAINRGGFPLAAHMMRRTVRYSRQSQGLPR